MSKTIVFDFDGVIHKYSKGWRDGSIYDECNQGIINIMQELMKEGYAVAIVSTRDPIQISEWWNNRNFPMKAIPIINGEKFYNDTKYVGVFNYKIPALIYIDDRAICFDGNAQHLWDAIISFKTYQEVVPEDKKSNLVSFAENELNILLQKCRDDKEAKEMQKIMNNNIMDIVKTFAEQRHSGFSANYAINLIEKLLRYEPITPLTGDDNEWTKLEYSKDTCYQNKRCSRVFKDEEGKAYDVEGKVFSDNNGQTWYTSKDSKVYIDFPYIPKTEEIIVNRENKVGE